MTVLLAVSFDNINVIEVLAGFFFYSINMTVVLVVSFDSINVTILLAVRFYSINSAVFLTFSTIIWGGGVLIIVICGYGHRETIVNYLVVSFDSLNIMVLYSS